MKKNFELEFDWNLKLIKLVYFYILMFHWKKQVGRNFWPIYYITGSRAAKHQNIPKVFQQVNISGIK